jgi:anti-sigma regulatory factor (Ser/Thr protein kinase)
MADVVTLELPRDRDFRMVAHLVLGGFASRLELTYDVLDDIQTALDELLERHDAAGDVTLSLRRDEGAVHATVGPFGDRVVDELRVETANALGLRRVLETVADGLAVEERDGLQWVELTKRVPGGKGA